MHFFARSTMKFIIHLLFVYSIGLLMVACQSENKLLDRNRDSHNGMEGVWLGTLPCADCPGILTEVLLKENFSFQTKMLNSDADAPLIVKTGIYQLEDSIITLDYANEGKGVFKLESDKLILIEQHDQLIETRDTANYQLHKAELNTDAFLNKKYEEEQIGFFATGNEPFWSIEIAYDEAIRFKPMDGNTFASPVPAAVQIPNGIQYDVAHESGDLQLNIYFQGCADDMSGALGANRVEVEHNGVMLNGCGDFYLDPRLNGQWQLSGMNGNEILPTEEKQTPTLHLNLHAGTATGNDGCNRLSGTVFPEGKMLNFSRMASTKMACPDATISTKFQEFLRQKNIQYTITGNQLMLNTKEDQLVFQPIAADQP